MLKEASEYNLNDVYETNLQINDVYEKNVKIIAIPNYQEELSENYFNTYSWSYQITIENLGQSPIQILSVAITVLDSMGNIYEVEKDLNTKSKENILATDKSIMYDGFAELFNIHGIIYGFYSIKNLDTCEISDIPIPAFSLDLPNYNNNKILIQ